MRVKETDNAWRVYFFEDATPEFTRDKWKESGFLVEVGIKNGKYVPIYVDYAKDRFSISQAISMAKKIEECPLCKQMNSNVGTIESLETKDEIPLVESYQSEQPQEPVSSPNPVSAPQMTSSSDPVSAFFKKLLYDAFLTRPGKMIWAQRFNDPDLIAELMPRNPAESMELVADLLDLMTGRVKPVKSREEIQEFSENLRDVINRVRGKESSGETKKKREGRKGTIIIS